MSAIVPFESQAVAIADAVKLFGVTNELAGGGIGFPVISIKGKVFHIKRGGEKTMVTKPGETDPAASIEVVIVKAQEGVSKTYYATGYVEGSEEAPTCSSANGIEPDADAAEPQAKKCATCPHSQWGSKITENGSKAKACADVKRLAVAPVGQLNDPMLLRVPAASLKAITEYSDTLRKRGLPYQIVVTKVGFDYSVAHPQLTFKGLGLIQDPNLQKMIHETMTSEVVSQIVGSVPVHTEEPKAPAALPAAAPAPAKPAPKAAPKPVATADMFAAVETAEAAPSAAVVEAAPEPAPKPAAKKAKPAMVEVDDLSGIEAALGAMLAGNTDA